MNDPDDAGVDMAMPKKKDRLGRRAYGAVAMGMLSSSASGDRSRWASSRRAANNSASASSTFSRASSRVFPCEKAPGTSGIVASHHPEDPCSKMMVSSFGIAFSGCRIIVHFGNTARWRESRDPRAWRGSHSIPAVDVSPRMAVARLHPCVWRPIVDLEGEKGISA